MILRLNLPVEIRVDDTYPFTGYIDEKKTERYVSYMRQEPQGESFELELLNHAIEMLVKNAIANAVADQAREEGDKAITWLKARDALYGKVQEYTHGDERSRY